MGLKATNDSRPKREPIPAETHAAVCVGYVDLGTQSAKDFKGNPTEKRRVMIFWDIPEVRVDYNGKSMPSRISNRYTLSLYEKANLRKMLDVWNGSPLKPDEIQSFDLDKLINRPAMIQVQHKPKPSKPGEVYENVVAVNPPYKGIPRPQMETDAIKYQIEDDATGEFVVPGDNIPRWIKKIIADSYEAKKAGWKYDAEADKAAAQGQAEADHESEVDETPF